MRFSLFRSPSPKTYHGAAGGGKGSGNEPSGLFSAPQGALGTGGAGSRGSTPWLNLRTIFNMLWAGAAINPSQSIPDFSGTGFSTSRLIVVNHAQGDNGGFTVKGPFLQANHQVRTGGTAGAF